MSDTTDLEQERPSSLPQRCVAYSVHAYTAGGLLCGVLVATAILSNQQAEAFFWMIVATVIDATDGPLARRFRVRDVLPHIDGAKLDDIVDYLNYTFLPMLMIGHFRWLPEPIWLWVSIPLVTSVLAFSHTGAKDNEDGFFLGFPSYWNIFAFYTAVGFQHHGRGLVLVLALLLSGLSLLPIRFVYPNRAPRWRPLFIGGGVIWMVILCVMLYRFSDVPSWLVWLSAVYPVFYIIASLYLDLNSRLRKSK